METKERIIQHHVKAESFNKLFRYFLPELVTSFLLYTILSIIDQKFIAALGNCASYSNICVTDTLFPFIGKMAEGFSVGMVIICGQYNGVEEYHKTGKALTDSFWATCIIGGIVSSFLYFGAHAIYDFYEVPTEMVQIGVPFLRLRALSVFFSFVYFALIGFLRGVKNTRAPMLFYMLGTIIFIFFDYALIFGKFGFSQMGLQGSALASVIQYVCMFIFAIIYIFEDSENKKYCINLFSAVRWCTIKNLVHLSWPVMIDKASLSVCYIWLAKVISGMIKSAPLEIGNSIRPSFVFIKLMMQNILLPGIAFAQVITFLVSNDYKAQNWLRIKNNIKKVLFISGVMVFSLLLVLIIFSNYFVSAFDKHGLYSNFVISVIPVMGIFVLFDLLQLILSAALRGAANVKTVMIVRICVTVFFFFPISYLFSLLPIDNLIIKFILVYGSFYIGNAIMSIFYIMRLRGEQWKQQSLKG